MKPLLSNAVLLLGFSAMAFSNPITLTFSGVATGTLGVTPFTDAAFTVTSTGDTGSVFVTPGPIENLPAIGATIDISGFSPATFLDPTSWIDPQGSGDIEFGDNGNPILAFTHLFAGLENYQFQNSLTVVGGFPFIPNLFENFQNIPTNEGLLTIAMTSDNVFTAVTTPEPALLWFTLVGVSVVIVGRRRSARA